MSRYFVRVAAIAVAATTIAAFAVPASATASTAAKARHVSTSNVLGFRTAPPAGPGSADTFLAGYVSGVGVTSIGVTLHIPTITCSTSNTQDIGWGAYSDPGSQTNLDYTAQADVQAVCVGGSPAYYVSAYTYGGGNNLGSASPGDLVIASVSENGTTTTSTVHDVTSGQTFTSAGSQGSDFFGWVAGYNYANPTDGYDGTIPAFSKVSMSKATINGDYLAYTSPSRYYMKDTTAIQEVAGLITRTGDGFTLVFKHA